MKLGELKTLMEVMVDCQDEKGSVIGRTVQRESDKALAVVWGILENRGPTFKVYLPQKDTEDSWFCDTAVRLTDSPTRAYTREEYRQKFIAHLRHLASYWSLAAEHNKKEAIEGALFSTLVLMDGGTGLPGVELLHVPGKTADRATKALDMRVEQHAGDPVYLLRQGEKFFPTGMEVGGNLHEIFFARPGTEKAGKA